MTAPSPALDAAAVRARLRAAAVAPPPASSPDRERWQNVACLVDTFALDELRHYSGIDDQIDWPELSQDADCVAAESPTGANDPGNAAEQAPLSQRVPRWRLKPTTRRQALLRVRSGLLSTLLARLPPVHGLRDQMLRARLSGPLKARTLDFEHCVALYEVLDWLDDGDTAWRSERNVLETQLARLQMFRPFERLLAGGFVGRASELGVLRDYVGILAAEGLLGMTIALGRKLRWAWSEHPPLAIHGPGGMGKSTLVAKFLFDHCGPNASTPLPFIYLDVDRFKFNAEDIGSVVVEAVRQLGRQQPELQGFFADKLAQLQSEAAEASSVELSTSGVTVSQWADRFAEIVSTSDFGRNESTPIILVVDTFEEIQKRGPDDEHSAWRLLEALNGAVPQLRVIVAGRSEPIGQVHTSLPLAGLSSEASRELVDRYVVANKISRPGKPVVDRLLEIANNNPLTLGLGLRLLRAHGVERLADVQVRDRFFSRLEDEAIQAQLYTRTLSHIKNPEIQKLARPGLAVRRITADIIENVLAKPCGVDVSTPGAAQQLFERLSQEFGLVVWDADGSLRHRSDVRAAMISNLTKDDLDTVARIDDLAIAYYVKCEGVIERAEEIYHRLRRGHSSTTLDKRWRPEVAAHLSGAIQEFPEQSQIYLSLKLNWSLPLELRERADQQTWELLTERRVRQLLNRGEAQEAIDALNERAERLPNSELWEMHVDALRVAGRCPEAVETATRGLARDGFGVRNRASLLVAAAFAQEANGQFRGALEHLQQAGTLEPDHDDELLKLRCLLAQKRVERKLDTPTTDRSALPTFVSRSDNQLNRASLRRLQARPALLRELVAEYAPQSPELLRFGLEHLGFPVESRLDAIELAAQLPDTRQPLGEPDFMAWLPSSTPLPNAAPSNGQSEVQVAKDEWASKLMAYGSKTIGVAVSSWLSDIPANPGAELLLTEQFRKQVDHRSLMSSPITADESKKGLGFLTDWL